MSIGNVNQNPSSLPISTPELAEDILETAQQAQVKDTLSEQSLKELAKNAKNNTQLVRLDAPVSAANDGDFYETIILALSNLAGLLGDMADSTIVELQFKRDETKRLLEEKLTNIEEAEQRRRDAVAMEDAMRKNQKRSGIFGSVMNFVFSSVEVIGGALIVVGGVLSANPGLIAGGAALAAGGVFGIAAEAVKVTGGSQKTVDVLNGISTGLMIAGIVMASYGAASSAAAGAAATKKAAQEGTEAAVKKGIQEGVEAAVKKSTKNAAKAMTNSGAATFILGASATKKANKVYSMYMTIQQHKYDVRSAELEQEITELSAKLEAVIQQQEFVNNLIRLLQERAGAALIGPVDDALKTLNETIQNYGATSTRIAASMAV